VRGGLGSGGGGLRLGVVDALVGDTSVAVVGGDLVLVGCTSDYNSNLGADKLGAGRGGRDGLGDCLGNGDSLGDSLGVSVGVTGSGGSGTLVLLLVAASTVDFLEGEAVVKDEQVIERSLERSLVLAQVESSLVLLAAGFLGLAAFLSILVTVGVSVLVDRHSDVEINSDFERNVPGNSGGSVEVDLSRFGAQLDAPCGSVGDGDGLGQRCQRDVSGNGEGVSEVGSVGNVDVLRSLSGELSSIVLSSLASLRASEERTVTSLSGSV